MAPSDCFYNDSLHLLTLLKNCCAFINDAFTYNEFCPYRTFKRGIMSHISTSFEAMFNLQHFNELLGPSSSRVEMTREFEGFKEAS